MSQLRGALLFCTIAVRAWTTRPAAALVNTPFLDLNADLGESFGIFVIGDDARLLASISSANLAAGFHGGDPSVLRRTAREAVQRGVAIGAHPSFPDLAGFGRREMQLSDWEVEDAVLYQIASVAGVTHAEGGSLRHVKPHGALYNMAAREGRLAEAIVRAVVAFDRTLLLFAPPGSALEDSGRQAGLRVVREGFADRRYGADRHLVSRRVQGSVIDDPVSAAQQAVSLALHGEARTLEGDPVSLQVETICVHGDLPGAGERARAVRAALDAAGVTVRALVRP